MRIGNMELDSIIQESLSEYVQSNKFWMRNLMCIDKQQINVNQFIDAIKRLDENSANQFIVILSKIAICLSVNKQKQIAEIISGCGRNYDIKYPSQIVDALRLIGKCVDDADNINLFGLIDKFCYSVHKDKDELDFTNDEYKPIEGTDNEWIRIYNWFNDDKPLSDYDLLVKIFPLVSDQFRMWILKRYMHDVRIKNTALNLNLIQQFKHNRNGFFIRVRNCINDKISISAQLLADCILTIIKSEGQTIQFFNGILDVAVMECEDVKSFDFESFIPLCNGGLLRETGLIEYDIICKVTDDKINNDNHLKSIINIILNKCNASNVDGKWNFTNYYDNVKRIRMFYPKKIYYPNTNDKNVQYKNIQIDESDFSLPYFKKAIMYSIDKFKDINEQDKIIIHSSEHSIEFFDTWLVSQFVSPIYVKVYPCNNLICGKEYNIFGLQCKDDEFNKTESSVIYDLIKKSLDSEQELDNLQFNYDKQILNKIKSKYGIFSKSDNFYKILDDYHKDKYYCAPKDSNKGKSDVLNIPFLWCNGKKCASFGLKSQTISECNSWEDYSLYHISEIIGFPMINTSNGKFEAKQPMRTFVSTINKAKDIFEYMKCKCCNHLIAPRNNGNAFNDYHYFECVNNTCSEFKKTIYLNHCYNCNNVIDSRETNKCNNNSYICNHCLSCCNDYGSIQQARKYLDDFRPVPQHINACIGKGHNNKNIYFCYKCKSQLDVSKDIIICESCKTKYKKSYSTYGDKVYFIPCNDEDTCF